MGFFDQRTGSISDLPAEMQLLAQYATEQLQARLARLKRGRDFMPFLVTQSPANEIKIVDLQTLPKGGFHQSFAHQRELGELIARLKPVALVYGYPAWGVHTPEGDEQRHKIVEQYHGRMGTHPDSFEIACLTFADTRIGGQITYEIIRGDRSAKTGRSIIYSSARKRDDVKGVIMDFLTAALRLVSPNHSAD